MSPEPSNIAEANGAKDLLLIELRSEELPPKSLQTLSESFAQSLFSALKEEGFTLADSVCTAYATPRRLALTISGVQVQQADRILEKKGPAVAGNLDANGQPSPALAGFMRSLGIDRAQLQTKLEGKNEYFFARIEQKGALLEHKLSELVSQALKKLPIAKLMRWGDGEHQFVRPVHGLIQLHGRRIVPGSVLGLHSGRVTLGHRFLSHGKIELHQAPDYVSALTAAKVIPSFAERRALIVHQLTNKAKELKAQLAVNDALIDEVCALVEYPAVYVGAFEAEYLEVPQECLILTMQQNQKYFPLFDLENPENGQKASLRNQFLIVSNMPVEDPKNIIGGNARVVRPRLADARFFYQQDLKHGLASRSKRLADVVYHKQLGSLAERNQRLAQIALAISSKLTGNSLDAETSAQIRDAAQLCKLDLLSDMVGEFPELQGVMGRYYALHEGFPAPVADAIEQHYRPRFAGDALPQGKVACAVALADKLDSLVAFFSIGQLPTGDKDPFGLRRAALGVLRILLETPLELDLAMLIDAAKAALQTQHITLSAEAEKSLLHFMFERLRGLLKDSGYLPDVIEAVLTQAPTRIDQIPAKLKAVSDFLLLPEAMALAAAHKRIANILKKSAAATVVFAAPDAALLEESAEKNLFHSLLALAPLVKTWVQNEHYAEALNALSMIRGEVDQFFEQVMVNVEQPRLRANRLNLLNTLHEQLNAVADIAKLAV
ncbi:MAG: glycine--tRNA ligase subunit beta [Pseudomonadota bacterium]